jgi:hypothetical protein
MTTTKPNSVTITNEEHPILVVMLALLSLDDVSPDLSDKERAYAILPRCGLTGGEILEILDHLVDHGFVEQDFKPTANGRATAVAAVMHLAAPRAKA